MSRSQTGGKTLSDFKVTEIRKVLIGRGLDGNGVKATLVARLEKALAEEGIEAESYYDKVNSEINGSERETNVENATVNEGFETKEELKQDPEIAIENEEKGNSTTIDLGEKVDEIDQDELNGDGNEKSKHGKTDNDEFHVISDAEDIDEMIAEEAAESEKEEKKEVVEEEKNNEEDKNEEKTPKLPTGLQFPEDDPEGKRCIWIKGIPIATKLSDLKLAFMDGGFTGEAKIFLTKDASHPSAFGFMILESEEMAKAAVSKMHNSIFKGKTIAVERGCDSSMFQSEVMPKNTERQRIHPPIQPPEKDKIQVTTEIEEKVEEPPQHKFAHVERRSDPRRRTPPYHRTVARARIVRESFPRKIIPSGSKIRVVAPRSPDIDRRIRRSPLLNRRRDEEDRHYEEMLRRREEEFLRKERALKAEVEAKKALLEKERLERENLELKLRLKEQERGRPRSPPIRRSRSPGFRRQSPISRRPYSPRRQFSPPRRGKYPPYKNTQRRTPPRYQDSRNYRNEPPKDSHISRRHSRSRSPIDRRSVMSRPPPPRFDNRRGRPYDSGMRRGRTPPRFDDRRPPPRVDDRRPPPRIDDRYNDRNMSKNDDLRDHRERNDRPGGSAPPRRHGNSFSDNQSDSSRRDPNYEPSTGFGYGQPQSFQNPSSSYPSSNSSGRNISQPNVWPTVSSSSFNTGMVNASPWPSTNSGSLNNWGLGNNSPFGNSTPQNQNQNQSNSRYRF